MGKQRCNPLSLLLPRLDDEFSFSELSAIDCEKNFLIVLQIMVFGVGLGLVFSSGLSFCQLYLSIAFWRRQCV